MNAPSSVVTVISAVPSATPVTRPLRSTVATAGAPLRHVTFWLAAFAGSTAAVSCAVALRSTVSSE